jgi:AAA domain/Primase C terminal 2 (PriCT-2)/Bifunctional DNA primase/polymerase, N-terminal
VSADSLNGVSNLDAVAGLRDRLWDAGYRPVALYSPDVTRADGGGSIELRSRGKRPVGRAWQERARRNPPEAVEAPPRGDAVNTGLMCDGLRVIDVDVDDRTVAAQVRALAITLFGETIMRTRANSGRCALVYRAAEGQPGKRAIVGCLGKVEVLGFGEQLQAFGRHYTGAALDWYPAAPDTVSVDTLPPVTEAALDAFLAAAGSLVGVEVSPAPTVATQAHIASNRGLAADPLDITAALAVIPNAGPADWERWNRIGLAVWAATEGHDVGLAAWDAWSARNSAYDPLAVAERWAHFRTSPPMRLGAGTLFHMARQACPNWRKPSELQSEPPPPGSDHPQPAEDTVDPQDREPEPQKDVALWSCDDAWSEENIPVRPWVARGYLLAGSVTLLGGTGSAGKSLLIKAWVIALVLGVRFGRFVPTRPCRVLSYNTEDDRHEERRRLSATLRQFDRTAHDLAGKLRLVGPTDIGTLIERDPVTGQIRLTAAMIALEQHIKTFQPDVVMLDPLVELHTAEENDNTGLRAVVAQLRALATRHNVAVCVLHHTRKGAMTPGDPDAVRGAGAIVGAARLVFTICSMTENDAERFGITVDARRHYFRLDGAKMNYSPVLDAEWFERVSYPLDNGEDVPATVPWSPPKDSITTNDIEIIKEAVAAGLNGEAYTFRGGYPRSLATLCARQGIKTDAGQRQIADALKMAGFKEADCRRGRTTAKGIRTPDGRPNVVWID